MAENKIQFRPYRGLEETIRTLPYASGYVYFATDTGKIFMDYNQERKIMGGGEGSTIYYAIDDNVNLEVTGKYSVHLNSITNLEEGNTPKRYDIIINFDGAFYKVERVEEHIVECERIAISGTGGGGGSGSTPGDTENRTKLEILTMVPRAFIYKQDFYIEARVTSPVDMYSYIRVEINGAGPGQSIIETYDNLTKDDIKKINIGKMFFEGVNSLIIYGGSSNTSESAPYNQFNLNVVNFELLEAPDFNPLKVHDAKKFKFVCVPNTNFSKLPSPARLEITTNTGANEIFELSNLIGDTAEIPVTGLTHGVHTLYAKMVTKYNNVDFSSNVLEYQIAIIEENNNKPLAWLPYGHKKEIQQYDEMIINYRVWARNNNDIVVKLNKEGNEVNTLSLKYNDTDRECYQWFLSEHDLGINRYSIQSVGGEELNITFNVIKDSRNLSVDTTNLIVNLNAVGRSNNESIKTRPYWISDINGLKVETNFNNFNWSNNGWVIDKEINRPCLRISNGASIDITLPKNSVFPNESNSKALKDSLALEFRFKVFNVKEYNFLQEENKLSTERGVFLNYCASDMMDNTIAANNVTGLCLGTQEAYFKTPYTSTTARYKEDSIINLTYVIDNPSSTQDIHLIYIYINGILSGITKFTSDDFYNPLNKIIINSNYCDVDLYNIRIYKGTSALGSRTVVHNYIADEKDVKAYDLNQIFAVSNGIPVIDYNKMITYNSENPDETLMPYMILTSADDVLPYVKGGKKSVSIDFHNPALEYAYNNGMFKGREEEYLYSAPSFRYVSNGAEDFDVQGTSSQGYPRRNYKWKAKQKTAKWTYLNGPLKDQPIYEYDAESKTYHGASLSVEGKEYKKYHLDSPIGETTFCLKADYMESSGTHNTGFASFVSTLYDKHPLEEYLNKDLLEPGLRTTIYGFPILVFQQKSSGQMEFIGRYNFNLDKGATDTCGFTHEGNSKVPKFKLANDVNIENFGQNDYYYFDDVINEYIKAENFNENIEYYTKDGYYSLEEIAECWEFKNNQGGRCSFTKVDFDSSDSFSFKEVGKITENEFNNRTEDYYYYDTEDREGNYYKLAESYNKDHVYYTKVTGALSVLDDFEYRYHYDADIIDEALEFKGEYTDIKKVNDLMLSKLKNFEKLVEWVKSTDTKEATGEKFGGTEEEPVRIYGETHDTAAYRLAKFKNEFEDHLDLEYCAIYFIMTDLLHLYDSRGKNCMMATWGPVVEGGEYIWFPIFYDIDTQLGINNSGVPSWDYDVEPTTDLLFSTANSVLWNNLWAVYSDFITSRYNQLRSGNAKVSISKMDGYYNAEPILDGSKLDSWKDILKAQKQNEIISYAKIGKRPAMIANTDQYYKYIMPTLVGYTNTLGNPNANDEGYHFYCAQGTRELSRYLYLRNRLNYEDSFYGGGTASKEVASGNTKFRINGNNNRTSDIYIHRYWQEGDPIPDPNPNLERPNYEFLGPDAEYKPLDARADTQGVKSCLKQYIRFLMDDRNFIPVRCDAKNPVEVKATSDINKDFRRQLPLKDQLLYIGNGEYITDIGDFGLKYINEINLQGLTRLERLKLGSDIEGYKNDTESAIGNFNLTNKMLREVVLTGTSPIKGNVNAIPCEKLEIFRALGTNITGITFADGVPLHTLHLPSGVNRLELSQPLKLEKLIVDSPYEEDRTAKEGLYIENVFCGKDGEVAKEFPSLSELFIEKGSLGVNSYLLLNRLIEIRENLKEEKPGLNIKLLEVNWSPYQLIEYGLEKTNNEYYVDNDRNQLIKKNSSEISDIEWEKGTKNKKIYLLENEDLLNTWPIQNLELLTTIINNPDQYKELDGDGTTNSMLTGKIFINNTTEEYSEYNIFANYKNKFPGLEFYFNDLTLQNKVSFVIREADKVTEREFFSAVASIDKTEIPVYEGENPDEANLDFIGWSTNPNAIDGSEEVYSSLEDLKNKYQFNNENRYYKFYAIFRTTVYDAYFYNPPVSPSALPKLIDTVSTSAGDFLTEPDILPKAPIETENNEERYAFVGWVASPSQSYPASREEAKNYLVNVSSIISSSVEQKFYACYVIESVYASATDSSWFNFTFEEQYKVAENKYIDGYVVSPKANKQLTGKITIPSLYEGKPIIGIEGFKNMPELTHIYFMSRWDEKNNTPSQFYYISDCGNNNKLQIVEWPNSLREILTDGLRLCPNLQYDYSLFESSSLANIGSYSFNQSFNKPIDVLLIPNTVQSIGTHGFSNLINNKINANYKIKTIQFGTEDKPFSSILDFLANVKYEAFTQNPIDGNTPICEIRAYTTTEGETDNFNEIVRNSKIFWRDDQKEFGSSITVSLNFVEGGNLSD